MLCLGRVYTCDRCEEQSIQEVRATEGALAGTVLVNVPEWLHGWELVDGALLCPGCVRLWDNTRREFFKRVSRCGKEGK